MFREHKEWVILGMTEEDELFDVPHWPERLCGMLADQASDNRLSYSDYLKPAHIGGFPAVIVLNSLANDDSASYIIVKKFVTDNRLKNRPGRAARNAGVPPLQQERRSEPTALPQVSPTYIKG